MNNPKEVWLPIEGLEGFYHVSNKGRVKSLPRRAVIFGDRSFVREGRVLSLVTGHSGYIVVCLCRNGSQKSCRVSRLVLAAFNCPPTKGLHANHIDGDKNNNEISNLEWVTNGQNMAHAVKNGLVKRGEDSPRAKLTDAKVASIRALRSEGRLLKELANDYGVSLTAIFAACSRKTWKHVA